MCKTWFVQFFLVLTLVSAQLNDYSEGKRCEVEEEDYTPGKCTKFYNCQYAIDRINVLQQQVTYCTIENEFTESLVCCPDNEFKTGLLGRVFVDSLDGTLTTGDIECRYTGSFPMVCCKRPRVDSQPTLKQRTSVHCADSDQQHLCNACFDYSEQKPGGREQVLCPQQTTPKIAFGRSAEIQEYPHMAILGCRNKKSGTEDVDIVWIGAGTLISPTWVLTAAHVLQSTLGKLEFAMLGVTNKTDTKIGILRNVVQRLAYKLYSVNSQDHDIALVELNMEVPFSLFVRPACLPVKGVIGDDELKEARIAGWGKSGQYQLPTLDLRAGEMTVQPCKNAGRSMFNWDTNIEFCAIANRADTCEGDSGGPLMMDIRGKSICGYFVFGIVSHGDVCGKNDQGHYTNVMKKDYLDWISKTVWPDGF